MGGQYPLRRVGRLEVAQKQGRNPYRREQVPAFEALFSTSLFGRLPQHGNEDWTPRMTGWVSVVMFGMAGKLRDEQSFAAWRLGKLLRSHWTFRTEDVSRLRPGVTSVTCGS